MIIDDQNGMNLPSIEPILPEDNETLPPARRRRKRRAIISPDGSDRVEFLNMLSQRVVPSFDFFLFSLLSGLVLGIGLLLDSPALVFLAALLAPFMAPVVGIALGTVTGAPRFFSQALASLLVGCLIVFVCGLLAGWMTVFFPPLTQLQAGFLARFDWNSFLVLSLGVGLTTYLVVRSPEQRPLVTSAAIAYGLYLPIGTVGFGLSSALPELWIGALGLFALYLVWSALLATLLLVILGLRPLNTVGYLLGGIYASLTVMAIVLLQLAPVLTQSPLLTPTSAGTIQVAGASTELPAVHATAATSATAAASATASQTPSETPQPPSATPSATPTHTLVPSRTATITNTPESTPIWARISVQEGNGALIREKPDYNATVVQSMLNGNLVEVLPEVNSTGSGIWVRVRTVNGKEGWVVRSLLTTATPAPNS